MLRVRIKSGMLIALSGLALSACFDLGVGSSSSAASGGAAGAPAVTSDPPIGDTVASGPEAGTAPTAAPPSISNEPPTVQVQNAAPVIAGIPVTQITADAHYEFRPSATDSDGDELRFSATGLPGWAGIDTGSGVVSGTPRAADAGQTADIVVSVSDGKDTAELNPFRVAVMAPPAPPPPPPPPGNDPPRISGNPGTTVQAQSSYSFSPSASDPEGQTLTWSISNKPSWAAFSTATGTLSGTPARDQDASYGGIVISVSDGTLSASLPAFTIVVSAAPNAAPTINGSPAGSVVADTAYMFRPSASDADGDPLTFSVSGLPSWANFDTSNGTLSGTPTGAQAGTYSNIVIRVNDGRVTTSLGAFSIVVSAAPNAAPTINGSPAGSVVADTAYMFRPSASDADGDPLTFSVSGLPSWANFDTSNGTLSGTPTGAQAGTYSNIVIRVSDGRVTTSLGAFSIVVNGPTMGSATLSWSAPTQNTDGSALTNLSGYRIYYGTSSASMGTMIQVSNPGITTYVVNNLRSGTYYFTVSAYNSAGAESDRSTVGSKAIP